MLQESLAIQIHPPIHHPVRKKEISMRSPPVTIYCVSLCFIKQYISSCHGDITGIKIKAFSVVSYSKAPKTEENILSIYL